MTDLTHNDSGTPGDVSPPAEPPQRVGVRQLMESLVCLALAVVLFRTFQMEGYMISTGSMAPCLLGFHQRVVCPTCRFPFAIGTAYDESVTEDARGGDRPGTHQVRAACPHCGQHGISVARVPVNQGDQLLVHKLAYTVRPPRRWEVVVFRNPFETTQAYVKRVVGLPGDAVQIVDGDVYIDGRIQQKTLPLQGAIRIPVYDGRYEPQNDRGWRPRWLPDEKSTTWSPVSSGFQIRAAESPIQDRSWVSYRHWVRAGGQHETSVQLPASCRDVQLDAESFLHVEFDPQSRRLSCRGVLTDETRDRLLAACGDPEYAAAIHRLQAWSHLAPVLSHCGYNQQAGHSAPAEPVRDLMADIQFTVHCGAGQFSLEMTDGTQRFRVELDVGRGEAHLFANDAEHPERANRRCPIVAAQTVHLEMSLFDRQVLVALDGRLLFEPLPIDAGDTTPSLAAGLSLDARRPVRFGAQGLDADVTALKLYRDVHYTRGKARHGIERPYHLGADEFFVLGDNSPVSSDSRNWADGAVPARLLIGKPLVVHLPSQPGEIRVGPYRKAIRIPDLGRIRYIR